METNDAVIEKKKIKYAAFDIAMVIITIVQKRPEYRFVPEVKAHAVDKAQQPYA